MNINSDLVVEFAKDLIEKNKKQQKNSNDIVKKIEICDTMFL